MFLVKTTLNYQLHQWLWRLSWLRNQLKWQNFNKLLVKLTLFLVLIVAVQFVYPSFIARPWTSVGGHFVGLKNKGSVEAIVSKDASMPVKVLTQDKSFEVSAKDIGLILDHQETATRAVSYSWRERLIPFSLFFGRKTVTNYSLKTQDEQVALFASGLAKYDSQPKNAVITISESGAIVGPSSIGYSYPADKVATQLKNINLDGSMSLRLVPVASAPAISTEAANQAAQVIQKRLEAPLTVVADDAKLEIDRATLASWMIPVADPEKGQIRIEYDRDKIKTKLLELSKYIYISVVPNQVEMIDGEVVAKANGASGQILQLNQTIDEIIGVLGSNGVVVSAKTQAVSPTTIFRRSYTRSSKGLQALLTYWASTHSGQFGITVKSVDGSISANYGGNKQFTSASIYKLYLSYIVYSKVTAGELSLSTATSTGASVGACIDAMIVVSDNNCAISLGNMVGWSANDGALHAKGYGSTTLTSGAHLTSANDAATWLIQLNNGSLNEAEYNQSLVSMMKRQIYRSGIPAGSYATVANKVGFLGGLNHDAAIVYHPKGSFVLVVMSSGSSFASISDLSRQIYSVMNQ